MNSKRLIVLFSVLLLVSSGNYAGKFALLKEPTSAVPAPKIPIIFDKGYDVRFYGLQHLHPFDSCKYGKIHEYLINTCDISPHSFYSPSGEVSEETLRKIHSRGYLDSLHSQGTLARITEIPLDYLPRWLARLLGLQECLLQPMKLATQGTLDAVDLAQEHGWAINLSGGYHHAKAESGGGFCVYADIPLAAQKFLELHPDKKVLIVDLDAHQGNGHEAVVGDDTQINIFDIYNEEIYPHDSDAKRYITYDHPVRNLVEDEEYLALLSIELPKAINETKPGLIIYNAGTDLFEKDPLGRMNISEEGIVQRDERVFGIAKERNIPIMMVLSGGYTAESAGIISRSIENLLDTVLIDKD